MRKRAAAALCILLAAALCRAGQLGGRMLLTLDGAVFQRLVQDGKRVAFPPAPLELELKLKDGGWDKVIGVSPEFNRGHHRGRVLEWKKTANGLEIRIEMNVACDPWIKGGRGYYEVSLRWTGEEALAGSFTGEFGAGYWGAAPVKGEATAILSKPLLPPPGFVPFKPGEHPRILFRKSNIARLKARIEKSHVVRAAWEAARNSNDMVALGVACQLTGERAYAQRAKPLVLARMKERGAGAFSTGHIWGARLADVARTCDLCTEAWDPDFNRQVVGYIQWITERLVFRPNSVSRRVNWSPNSNYHNWLRGGAALGALALATDKGAPPSPPRDPGTEPLEIKPLTGFTPRPGVPVVPLENKAPLKKWLVAGPLKDRFNTSGDLLAHLGGPARAHEKLAPGVQIRLKDKKAAFEPLPMNEKFFWGDRVEFTAIFSRNLPKKEDGYRSVAYFYTVVRNDRRRLVQFTTGSPGSATLEVWLAGRKVEKEDYLELPAGLLPVVVRAWIGETSPWGRIWMEPRLSEITRQAAIKDLARRRVLYGLALAEWKEDYAD